MMHSKKENYENLKEKVRKEGLLPDSKNPGEFIKNPVQNQDGIGFLMFNNWIFHDQIVEKVLDGKYNEINPVCAEFDVTLNCSNRCGICGYNCVKMLEGCWIKNNFKDPEMHMPSFEYARDFLDTLIDGGIKGVIFTGGGEPFLFRGLEKLVAHATSRGADCVNYTNGNAVSETRLIKLIEASPLLVRVSLNAGTEEVYNAFHNPLNPKGAIERCLNTIRILAEGSLRNPKMDVGVGVVINEINQDDLVNATIRVREIYEKTGGGIKFMTFRPEIKYYTSNQITSEVLDKTHEIVETQVKKVLDGTGINVNNVSCRYDSLKRNTRNYSLCRASGFITEATPGRKLFLCCDRNFNRKYFIGAVEKDILSVHHGPLKQQVLNYVNSNNCEVCPPACKSHETNIQFQKIEELRAKKEMYKVRLWIEEQRKLPKPKMVNFP